MLPIPFADLGMNALLSVLSLAVGLFAALFGILLESVGILAVGFIEAVASGGRVTNRDPQQRNGIFAFLRCILWFAMIGGSFLLVLFSLTWVGFICGIIGGICLPLDVSRLLRRPRRR